MLSKVVITLLLASSVVASPAFYRKDSDDILRHIALKDYAEHPKPHVILEKDYEFDLEEEYLPLDEEHHVILEKDYEFDLDEEYLPKSVREDRHYQNELVVGYEVEHEFEEDGVEDGKIIYAVEIMCPARYKVIYIAEPAICDCVTETRYEEPIEVDLDKVKFKKEYRFEETEDVY